MEITLPIMLKKVFNIVGEVVKEYESKHATSEDGGDFEVGSLLEVCHKLLFLRIQVWSVNRIHLFSEKSTISKLSLSWRPA